MYDKLYLRVQSVNNVTDTKKKKNIGQTREVSIVSFEKHTIQGSKVRFDVSKDNDKNFDSQNLQIFPETENVSVK